MKNYNNEAYANSGKPKMKWTKKVRNSVRLKDEEKRLKDDAAARWLAQHENKQK